MHSQECRHVLVPNKWQNSNRPLISDKRSDKLFGKLNLEGLNDWPEDQQQKAVELLKEFHHLFVLDDLDMGCTSQVKHKIKLMNPEPFKQRYRRIPPNQFQEVKKHLEEMLKVGAIWKSISPWASPVVLIRKKDSTLKVLYRPVEIEHTYGQRHL